MSLELCNKRFLFARAKSLRRNTLWQKKRIEAHCVSRRVYDKRSSGGRSRTRWRYGERRGQTDFSAFEGSCRTDFESERDGRLATGSPARLRAGWGDNSGTTTQCHWLPFARDAFQQGDVEFLGGTYKS